MDHYQSSTYIYISKNFCNIISFIHVQSLFVPQYSAFANYVVVNWQAILCQSQGRSLSATSQTHRETDNTNQPHNINVICYVQNPSRFKSKIHISERQPPTIQHNQRTQRVAPNRLRSQIPSNPATTYGCKKYVKYPTQNYSCPHSQTLLTRIRFLRLSPRADTSTNPSNPRNNPSELPLKISSTRCVEQ